MGGFAVVAAAGDETVAVGVTVVGTLVVAALAAAVAFLLYQARSLRQAAAELRRDSAARLDELDRTLARAAGELGRAGAELDRVGDLIGSAESISDAVGGASRLASTAMAGPVIKAVALGSGAARAGRRLRRGPGLRARR
jgi:hypothetical protein